MAKYVNLTPRWSEIMPTLLMLYRQAVEGDCMNPDLIKENMTKEFMNCAKGCDRYGDLVQYLRAEGWTDERFIQALEIGREKTELARNTVHEED